MPEIPLSGPFPALNVHSGGENVLSRHEKAGGRGSFRHNPAREKLFQAWGSGNKPPCLPAESERPLLFFKR